MKNLALFLIALFSTSFIMLNSCKTTKSATSQAQEVAAFNGIVKYKYLLENVENLSAEEIEQRLAMSEKMLGRHITYYIKEDKIKSVVDGSFMKMTTFSDRSDSMYVYIPDRGELSKLSMYDGWNFTYDTMYITKKAGTLAGVVCDMMTFESEKYRWFHYYNPTYRANPDYYVHQPSLFMNDFVAKTGCLPLRSQGKIPGGYIFIEAEEIILQVLDDEIFEVPKE